jgi:L-amino acid N-acyltransferase YncA
MTDAARLKTRAATVADATAIAEIYNQGIADRIAAFETEPRAAADFGASFPYSSRPCYRGIGEFSVYVRQDYRGRGAGRTVLAALIEAATAAGLHKLSSRVFPENTASRALLKGLGFEEIGVHRRHGQLDGRWRDCVIVERLLDEGATE